MVKTKDRGLPSNVFRAGTGVVIMDLAGRVLAFERKKNPGSWQFPQGGLIEHEEPLTGALRELKEETGLGETDVVLIAEYPGWLAYELPEEYKGRKFGLGQVQKWFYFRLVTGDSTINLNYEKKPEFIRWRWTDFPDVIAQTAVFRRPVYVKLAEYWKELR